MHGGSAVLTSPGCKEKGRVVTNLLSTPLEGLPMLLHLMYVAPALDLLWRLSPFGQQGVKPRTSDWDSLC